MRVLRNTVIDALILVVVGIFRVFPRTSRRTFAFFIAKAIFLLAQRTRKRAMSNIVAAMPNLTQKEAKKIALRSYKNIVFGVLECFWLEELEIEYCFDDEVNQLLASGNGLMVATMHMSCYEIVPFALQRLTQRSTTLSNVPEFASSARQVYEQAGIDCIHKKQPNAFLDLLQALKNHSVVSLHSDHFANDLSVSFFGRKTGAPSGVAMLSAIAKVPLLVGYAVLNRDGKYQVSIELLDSLSEKVRADPNLTMQHIYQKFEQIILQYPEQWYWSYKRWR